MLELADKQVLVIGLGRSGQAACEFLRRSGAQVTAVDQARTPDLLSGADRLRPLGIEVTLGVSAPPERNFNLAVLSSALPGNAPLVEAVRRNKVPLISELELGFQQSRCLTIAIAGTNGKGTTAELVERVLTSSHRRAALSGDRACPVCSVIEQTRDLDYLVFQTDVFQLEITDSLRPSIAVLTSLTPEHLDHFGNADNYVRAQARLFSNQQALDWAIVQREALARLHELDLPVPAKTLTFSADEPNADLHLCRGQIVSRIPNWSGSLMQVVHCQLGGPHYAENLMAALAVGHVLRLPPEAVVDSLKTYCAGPHCCQLVAEVNGVQFINDSRAANVDALGKALLATRLGPGGEANIWLITGARDKRLDFNTIGSLLSRRAKHVFLVGEASRKTRAALSVFTPCTMVGSLLEAVAEAARNATSGDVVLLSPACSSWDESLNHQCQGEAFCQAVKSIGRGLSSGTPNINGSEVAAQQ